MRLALKPHPDSRCGVITNIDVEVVRAQPRTLTLRYVVIGDIDDVLIPSTSAPVRTDGLWQHTCFEAFVRPASGEGYYEFNLAPSTEWAAYRFTDYRSGMAAAEISPPLIEARPNGNCYALETSLELDQLAAVPWQIALSAVIEEANGRKSYWALAHPPGKADFHHPDSFVHELR